MADTTKTLIFSPEKEAGALPVKDEYGRVLARVSAPSSRGHFTVTDSQGRRLCSASAEWWRLGVWTVTDADGERLLSVTTNLLRSRALVDLDRDGELVLEGDGPGDGFTIRDASGRCVVETGSRNPARGPVHEHDVVRVHAPDVLHLADVVSVARIWHLVTKAGGTSTRPASTGAAPAM